MRAVGTQANHGGGGTRSRYSAGPVTTAAWPECATRNMRRAGRGIRGDASSHGGRLLVGRDAGGRYRPSTISRWTTGLRRPSACCWGQRNWCCFANPSTHVHGRRPDGERSKAPGRKSSGRTAQPCGRVLGGTMHCRVASDGKMCPLSSISCRPKAQKSRRGLFVWERRPAA
ncbi:hypothetical protein BT67DRAFT_135062 [Trichocladium antarcticum]|uniref:Uncharacterized protein n=1 Tax=Trichocladium antarcticum TaxID=1450529 RepID=A0AAN6ZBK2_9PEZI|nr:hypothetical protein BT67DRAFT_135062 [Trichocladium antarcticum]